MTNPIFIVGPSRSGTELVRSILNNARLIHISNETHYFDDLRPRLKRPEIACDAEDGRLVAAYFEALRHHAYGLHRQSDARPAGADGTNTDRDAMSAAASADEMFEAYCRSKASGRAQVWGEKTPRHVFRIGDIKRAYPQARIIVCLRDPRGVVASYRDWKNRWFEGQELDDEMRHRLKGEEDRVRKSYSLLIQCLMWNSAVRSALSARTNYGGNAIHFLKFEDLLRDPGGTIERLCAWLGLPFQAELLDIMMVNSSYTDAGTVRGVSHEPSRRWATTLSEREIGLIEMVTGGAMTALGYQRSAARPDFGYSLKAFCHLPAHMLRALHANRHRIPNIGDYLVSRARGSIQLSVLRVPERRDLWESPVDRSALRGRFDRPATKIQTAEWESVVPRSETCAAVGDAPKCAASAAIDRGARTCR